MWTLPKGFSFSAYYGYGSPNPAYTTSTNVDPLGIGSTRVRADLSVIPRNNFYGDAFQTLDLHLSKDVRIGFMKLTGIAEVFNAFNYAQFTYNTLETSPTFGAKNGQANTPRTGQLGSQDVLLVSVKLRHMTTGFAIQRLVHGSRLSPRAIFGIIGVAKFSMRHGMRARRARHSISKRRRSRIFRKRFCSRSRLRRPWTS